MRWLFVLALVAAAVQAHPTPIKDKIQRVLAFLKDAKANGEFAVNTPTGIYPIHEINEGNLLDIFNFRPELEHEIKGESGAAPAGGAAPTGGAGPAPAGGAEPAPTGGAEPRISTTILTKMSAIEDMMAIKDHAPVIFGSIAANFPDSKTVSIAAFNAQLKTDLELDVYEVATKAELSNVRELFKNLSIDLNENDQLVLPTPDPTVQDIVDFIKSTREEVRKEEDRKLAMRAPRILPNHVPPSPPSPVIEAIKEEDSVKQVSTHQVFDFEKDFGCDINKVAPGMHVRFACGQVKAFPIVHSAELTNQRVYLKDSKKHRDRVKDMAKAHLTWKKIVGKA